MEESPRDRFLASLERCSENERFIPTFYDRFLSSSHEVREKFKETNFEQQNRMLLRSLRMAAGATAGEPESLREIKERATTHDRHHLNIEPRHYDCWVTTVIAAAEEFDPVWNEAIEAAWTATLGHVVKHMTKFY